MDNSTTRPIPPNVVLSRFLNGFLNGYILHNNFTSNVEDKDAELYDLEFLISIWKYGVQCGTYYKNIRYN